MSSIDARDSHSKKNNFVSKSRGSVQALINNVDKIIIEEKGTKAKIKNLDRSLMTEKIKEDQFIKMTNELNKLKDQSP
jgi:hypothetical protein